MIRTALAAAALLAPASATAAEAALPAEPWPKAVACSAYLFVASENLKAAKSGQYDKRAGWRLNTIRGSWYAVAQAQPEYSADRFSSEMSAYIQGPLGPGAEALTEDARVANMKACISDGVKAEFEAREKPGK
ncbi:MAG TPA: hypothetical protein VF138_01335 [Caulobacteraceae bacterium]